MSAVIFAAIKALSGDHSAMARLVEPWLPKDPSWTNVNPVCKWAGVNCTAGRVVQFIWENMGCTGPVNLTGLPTGMTSLRLAGNGFSGPVDLTCLPTGMTTLALSENSFSGPVDLTRLPTGMTYLGLGFNEFSGPLDLTRLPTGMTELVLFGNDFCGSTGIDIPCDDVYVNDCTCAGAAVQCPAC